MLMHGELTLAECLERLKQNQIVIYGTGHVGRKFLLALKKLGLESQIACFAKTTHAQPKENIEGIAVRSISEITGVDEDIVCLAVHSSIKDELIHELKKNNIRNYIWIYPYLYRMLLGAPVAENVAVDVDKMKNACLKDYRMAIRWLAIEQYLGKNDDGYDLYIKGEALHCSRDTAEKRLHKFSGLIRNWIKYGYDSKHKVLISEDYEVIDGNHRVALAIYFGEKHITCDIYSLPDGVSQLHGEEAMLTKEILVHAGFSAREISVMDEMMERTKGVLYEEA